MARVVTLGFLTAVLAGAGVARPAGPAAGRAVPASEKYQVACGGKALAVRKVTVNPTPEYQDIAAPAAMVNVEVAGRTTLTVTVDRPLRSAEVRPASRDVPVAVAGNVVTLTLDRPGAVVLLPDGSRDHPLFVFGNPPRADRPRAGDPGVIAFGPGEHHPGRITLKSDQTLYLDDDAVVHGFVAAEDARNIRVTGRGILTGMRYKKGEMGQKLVALKNCQGVRIEDVTCLDSPEWNVQPVNCRDVVIDNIKVIGWRRNSDAIDPVNCQRLTIRDCFLKGQDDGVTVKGFGPDAAIEDISVERTVFWNNWMRSMVVGGELANLRRLDKIRFSDCDVVYSGTNPKSAMNRDAALSVWNVDNATVSGVVFDGIRVDEADRLVRVAVVKNKHSRTKDYGRVRGVTFRNVTALKGRCAIEITGHDADHLVEDVTFENLRIGGRLVRRAEDCDYTQNEFVRNVRFVVTEGLEE